MCIFVAEALDFLFLSVRLVFRVVLDGGEVSGTLDLSICLKEDVSNVFI